MHSQFYIGAYGSENDICALHERLKFPGSEIRPLKCKLPIEWADQGMQWLWHSPYQECSSNFPENELTIYLNSNSNLIRQLKSHRGTLCDLVATIVCHLNAGEPPYGYSISLHLMKLLSEIDASLEIDFVQEDRKEKDREGGRLSEL